MQICSHACPYLALPSISIRQTSRKSLFLVNLLSGDVVHEAKVTPQKVAACNGLSGARGQHPEYWGDLSLTSVEVRKVRRGQGHA